MVPLAISNLHLLSRRCDSSSFESVMTTLHSSTYPLSPLLVESRRQSRLRLGCGICEGLACSLIWWVIPCWTKSQALISSRSPVDANTLFSPRRWRKFRCSATSPQNRLSVCTTYPRHITSRYFSAIRGYWSTFKSD